MALTSDVDVSMSAVERQEDISQLFNYFVRRHFSNKTYTNAYVIRTSPDTLGLDSGVGSNLQVGAQCRRQVPAENLWMCPHLSIVPPHEGAQLAA